MHTKRVKDLASGDLLQLSEPDGVARVTNVSPMPIIEMKGDKCFEITAEVVDGPGKGETMRLLQGGNDEAVLAGTKPD